MHLSGLDYSIIIAYFLIVLGVGLWISKLARNNLDLYLLGGNKIKWYFLGLSNASRMFYISVCLLLYAFPLIVYVYLFFALVYSDGDDVCWL